MKQNLPLVALLLILAGGAAAPASAADKATQQMMADVRILQEQSQQLQIMVGALAEALKSLNTRLDGQAEVTRKAFADQKLTMDALSNDLRVVRERADDTNVRIGSLGQEVEALHQAVQTLNVPAPVPAEPAPDALGGTAPSDPAAPPVAPAPAAPTTVVVTSPQRLWNEAESDYMSARYDLAVLGFESYIKTFPKSDRVDDAQLHIGKSYESENRFTEAVDAYDVVLRTYPNGNAASEAAYRKGLALMRLQQADRAREAFELVVKNYPDSDFATLAKQRLPAAKP